MNSPATIDTRIIREPESLVGLGVNWTHYIPAGGWEFQRDFNDFWLPRIAAEIKDLTERKEASRNALTEYAEVQRDLATARNALLRAREYFEKNPSVKEAVLNSMGYVSRELGSPHFEWLDAAPEHANGLWSIMDYKHETSSSPESYDKDIEFLNTFRDYFLFDRELDMLLWAKSLVPVKYRTSVHRACYKLARDQFERMTYINSATSKVAMDYKVLFCEPLNALQEGNTTAYEALKAEQKAMKRYGKSDFYAMETDYERELAKNREVVANLAAGNVWTIVRPAAA